MTTTEIPQCGTCGTRVKHSDRYGCCGGCGRLFRGLTAFDGHFGATADGTRGCRDPLTLTKDDGTPRYETIDVPGGVMFVTYMTEADRERVAALTAEREAAR